ncbi:hypothetical protein ARMSODRAFT_978758 [Armillaria solidipes]|uniref:Uncharacterized protein n=1 Tax=Armillaria solidipes TaxID=1076256 RepID=A0A2H3B1J3_9AGAR|nr:hypothetical protein ARMSODRAFT_978758 [Armillaria solidipes]
MDRKEWLSHYPHVSRGIFPNYEWVKFPKVTLSAPTGTGQIASIPVLKQWSYIGKRPIIPSPLADTPCSDLSIQGLLEKFNIILNTSYTLSIPSWAKLSPRKPSLVARLDQGSGSGFAPKKPEPQAEAWAFGSKYPTMTLNAEGTVPNFYLGIHIQPPSNMPEHDQPDPSCIVQGSRMRCPTRPFGEADEILTTSQKHSASKNEHSDGDNLQPRRPAKRNKSTNHSGSSSGAGVDGSDEIKCIEKPSAPKPSQGPEEAKSGIMLPDPN